MILLQVYKRTNEPTKIFSSREDLHSSFGLRNEFLTINTSDSNSGIRPFFDQNYRQTQDIYNSMIFATPCPKIQQLTDP